MNNRCHLEAAALCLSLMMLSGGACATNVLITVDVESFQNGDPQSQIWGAHPSGYFGINLIMELLEKHSHKATFYLNVYESAKHGTDAIREVAHTIHERGHDLQLHTHPYPMYDVRTMQRADLQTQTEILRHGKQLIFDWTGKEVLAHRAGAFAANLNTLKAAEAAGLKIDSSFSPVSKHTALAQDVSPSNAVQLIHGVLEVPITHYAQISFRSLQSLRYLDVEGTTLAEFKSVIRQFRDIDFPVINIMMHSFSLIRSGTPDYDLIERFDLLLEFLADEPGIDVITVSQMPLSHGDSGGKPDRNFVPQTGPWLTYRRAVEHIDEGGLNTLVAIVPLCLIAFALTIYVIGLHNRSIKMRASLQHGLEASEQAISAE